ncbi:MAG TPA: MBL fold metallo-hydrolase [Solirubrobacterales bacterium]|jgi:L-ascorbate metabolism protein UlaG (beta-lactamase superfamily)
MRVEWHGQSAFAFEAEEGTVFVDPFGEMTGLSERGIEWSYPEIGVDGVDLLLVTHEHRDHNAVEAVGGEPHTLRATAGTHETPLGTVVGVASEHDAAAGTERGPNTIFVFSLGGVRVAHFGDFGQAALRPEQKEAIGEVDLAIVPVGGGPTIGGAAAAEIALSLGARWVVPMHYRTHRISFLEDEEEFAAAFAEVMRFERPKFDTDELDQAETGAVAVIPVAP